jgi:hypothetical protein
MTDQERLAAAEAVCVMYGWSAAPPAQGGSDREIATLELWMRWAKVVGSEFLTPKAHPELNAAAVKRLVEARRDTVQRIKAKIDKLVVTVP